MTDVLDRHLPQLRAFCLKYRVKSLDAMGSVTRDDFDPDRSDLDFVVEFDQLTTEDAADRYFGLLHDLEDLFGLSVDLISYPAIRNPYFKQVVNHTRKPLYAARVPLTTTCFQPAILATPVILLASLHAEKPCLI